MITILVNGYLISGIISGSILLILLIGLFLCFRMAFLTNKKKTIGQYYFPKGEEYEPYRPFMKQLVNDQENVPFEEIYIKTKDHKKLFGRYYHVQDGAPIQIQFHGYRGNGIRDFCGGNKLARELKHNSILVDQRAHGQSSGNRISFGIKEKYDVKEWVNYAINRFGKDVKIILCGISMGASTILMASELDLPSNVVGIIADCPYSDHQDILKKVIKDDMKLPVKLCYPVLYVSSLVYGPYCLSSKPAKDAVKNTLIPICLIHGEQDTFVPPYMSKQIKENCNSYCELHLFPKAEHGISYIIDPEKYAQIVSKFCEKVLN